MANTMTKGAFTRAVYISTGYTVTKALSRFDSHYFELTKGADIRRLGHYDGRPAYIYSVGNINWIIEQLGAN